MTKYKNGWIENLKLYNEEHNTNYTFKDIEEKFIEAGEIESITKKCMCNHDIERNFKIKNIDTNDTMIVGSICIKKYIPKAMTTCKKCNLKFKFNGKNKCRKCRTKISIKCNFCNKVYKMKRYKTKKFIKCKECIEDEKSRCKRCNKKKDMKYKYCYNCNIYIKKQKYKKRII